jgi:hypothetical protein
LSGPESCRQVWTAKLTLLAAINLIGNFFDAQRRIQRFLPASLKNLCKGHIEADAAINGH